MNAMIFRKIVPKEGIPPIIINNPKRDLQIWTQAVFAMNPAKTNNSINCLWIKKKFFFNFSDKLQTSGHIAH